MQFAQHLYKADNDLAESLCQKAMMGKGAFAIFLQFLASHQESTCGFILQAQSMSLDQRNRFMWRETKAAKDVTAWLGVSADRVAGHSAHKQRLAANPSDASVPMQPLESGNDVMTIDQEDKAAYVTMFAPHTCNEAAEALAAGGSVVDGSDSISLTSASALRDVMRRKTNSRASAASLAWTLQLGQPARSMQETTLPNLSDKLAAFGPIHRSQVKQVRRYLVSGHRVNEGTINNLLQGAIALAKEDGDYAELIEATAREVKDRMYEMAKHRYVKQWARRCQDRRVPMPPFNPSADDIPDVPDTDGDGHPISYLIGWCLAPGYVRNGIGKDVFCKFTAIDCAFAKRHGQGTFYLETILGGDRSIHFVYIMHLLATECDFGVNLHHKHTASAYNGRLNANDFVCGTDGGISLIKGVNEQRPDTHRIRDFRHLLLDIKSPRVRKLVVQLHSLPPSRKEDVREILSVLQKQDIEAHKVLTNVPLEQWCRAFMPPEACHHGNKVTSSVEVGAAMIIPARLQTTLAASFITVKEFIRLRWINLRLMFTPMRKHVPVRIEKFEKEQMLRATNKNTSIDARSCPDGFNAHMILTQPSLLDTPITVNCTRSGRLSVRPSMSDEKRSWDFISGSKDEVVQQHIVTLSCIKSMNWYELCTCRRNGTEVQYCSEVTYVLEAFWLKETLRKPWTTITACKEQLGSMSPVDISYEEVSRKMCTLTLKNYIQPRIPNSHKGGRPSAAHFERTRPMQEVAKDAQGMMNDAMRSTGSHKIPCVPAQIQTGHIKRGAPTSSQSTELAETIVPQGAPAESRVSQGAETWVAAKPSELPTEQSVVSRAAALVQARNIGKGAAPAESVLRPSVASTSAHTLDSVSDGSAGASTSASASALAPASAIKAPASAPDKATSKDDFLVMGEASGKGKEVDEEVKRKLRLLGQPIQLFGEDDKDRLERYQALVVAPAFAPSSIAASNGHAHIQASASAPASAAAAGSDVAGLAATEDLTFNMLGSVPPGKTVFTTGDWENGRYHMPSAKLPSESADFDDQLADQLADEGGMTESTLVEAATTAAPSTSLTTVHPRTLRESVLAAHLKVHITFPTMRLTKSGHVEHSVHDYELSFNWQQTYASFVSSLVDIMLDSDSTIVRTHAKMPLEDLLTTLQWEGCRPITRTHISLSMSDALQSLGDDDIDNILEDHCFHLEIRQPCAPPPPECRSESMATGAVNPGQAEVPFFETDDIVLEVLRKLTPWYLLHNVKALLAFSSTCWGAQRLAGQLVRGAVMHEHYLPLPLFPIPTPPVQDDFADQWNSATGGGSVVTNLDWRVPAQF